MWAPGTKVECIDDASCVHPHTNLVLGKIYTVKGPSRRSNGVILAEIDPPIDPADGIRHSGFSANLFRPIVERKLPECLTELLKTPKRESEPA